MDKIIEKNMLKQRAEMADEITEEKFNSCNVVNRDMMNEFLEVNNQLSKETRKQYTSTLRQFFYFVYEKLNNKPFYQITKRDFIRYMSFMQERGLSSSAISLKKSAVSSFCNYIENIVADDMEECKTFRNFTKGMPTISKDAVYVKKSITAEEYEKICNYLKEHQMLLELAWVVTAYNVGARRSELRQFKTEMMDYVPKEGENYILSHPVRGKGKGEQGKVIRYMIPLWVRDAWKQWIDYRGYENEYIFTVKHKGEIKPISQSWADDLCENILSQICGRRINPHLFKSTCITNLLEKGVDMKIVSKYIAQHESAETTALYDLRDFEEEKNKIF